MPVLLVPAVRSPAQSSLPRPRSPRLRPAPPKLIRARSGSTSLPIPHHDTPPFVPPSYAEECFGIPLKFVAEPELLRLEGYQMYAVEKWVVDRRPIPVLSVYTGDASHKITFTAFKPSPLLSPAEAQAEWDKAIHHLRADGARPKQTPHGTLMATSLAHFRSDYTIVYIPNGNYLAAREQLYTNINLLRTGCSGRSALTLEEPSDTTKDRFISTYHLPDTTDIPANHYPTSTDSLPLPQSHLSTPTASPSSKPRHNHSAAKSTDFDLANLDASKTGSFSKAAAGLGLGLPSALNHGSPTSGKTRDRATFNATVLELVKLIQAGLSIFGSYGSVTCGHVVLDGLLCDQTVEGMSKWIGQFGEHLLGLEPMERIADPTLVSSLLSTVLSIRNRLSVIGYSHLLPRDPFLHPYSLSLVLATYNQAATSGHTHGFNHSSNALSLAVHPHHNTVAYSPHNSGYTSTGGQASASSSISGALNSPHPSLGSSTTSQVGLTLSRDLFLSISSTYDSKTKLGEGRKVRKVIREKLDDLTSAVAGGVGASAAVDEDEDLRAYASSVPTTSHGVTGAGGGLGGVEAEGPILSGIGSLASGLGLVGGSPPGGTTANIMDTITDLATFARIIAKDAANLRPGRGIVGKGKAKTKDKRESIDGFGSIGYGYSGKEKERDIVAASVAGTVKALWSGRVWSIIRLREWEAERDRELIGNSANDRRSADRARDRAMGVVSDGDVEGDLDRGRHERSDGRTTEEESDPVVAAGGGFWGERVQRKLAWTGLTRLDGKVNRKKGGQSLDLSTLSTTKGSSFPISISKLPDIPSTPNVVPPQSPTLVATNSLTGYSRFEDDDLPSSGQVSPVAEGRTNRFAFFHEGHSGDGSATGSSVVQSYADFDRKAFEFDSKYPWKFRPIQNRISSWADPRSAWMHETKESGDDFETAAEDVHATNGNGKSGGGSGDEGVGNGDDLFERSGSKKGVSIDDEMVGYMPRARGLFMAPKRRRSFHDLESFRDIYVLRKEQMRVDVDLCGQLLVMMRRDEHLRNVTAAVEVIVNSLSKTNTALRDNYEKHAPYLTNPGIHTSVISDINNLYLETNKTSQITNTLLYESEQLRIGDLWQTASPSRHKVLDLREKVFGTGGRRLPQGVHGAHGKFNRLQWTLDGQKRLVDKYGRTESEAEQEDRCIAAVNSYAGAGTGSERRDRSSFLKERTEDEGELTTSGVTTTIQARQEQQQQLLLQQMTNQNGLGIGESGKTEKGSVVGVVDRRTDEEEVDAVPHARIKPLWLLKVFTRWGGGVWGGAAGGGGGSAGAGAGAGIHTDGGPGSSSSSPAATAITSAVAPAVDATSAVVASAAAIATVAVSDVVSAANAATITFKEAVGGSGGAAVGGDQD
ncbi:hypothetical protein BDN72DRAFT_355244 [Pluteus cervinus]|uniref:Uncharacterized protein n=1 Tax=Pluteus cervinus TaxID=181527 RepID=A0ACD3BD29_9AGAR|nr:hypothetical protein BDN72DRAFT_355244 [Pluteus cervinus]